MRCDQTAAATPGRPEQDRRMVRQRTFPITLAHALGKVAAERPSIVGADVAGLFLVLRLLVVLLA